MVYILRSGVVPSELELLEQRVSGNYVDFFKCVLTGFSPAFPSSSSLWWNIRESQLKRGRLYLWLRFPEVLAGGQLAPSVWTQVRWDMTVAGGWTEGVVHLMAAGEQEGKDPKDKIDPSKGTPPGTLFFRLGPLHPIAPINYVAPLWSNPLRTVPRAGDKAISMWCLRDISY